MNRTLLEKPFSPDQIKQRSQGGDVLEYVEGSAVIQRLNDAFDAEWSFEIVEHRILEDEVLVFGRLTAAGVSKSQFGKSKVTRAKESKKEISLGDDLKAAATDCIKKCATLFGVGLHLYFDEPGTEHGNVQHAQTKPANGSNGGSTSGNGNGNGGGRLTARQLSAIFAIARSQDLNNKAIRDLTQKMFGKLPDFLSAKEASAVIDHLKGGE